MAAVEKDCVKNYKYGDCIMLWIITGKRNINGICKLLKGNALKQIAELCNY
jgi:hypothetical protein